MNQEVFKNLNKKKKLAIISNLGGVVLGAGVGLGSGIISYKALFNAKYEEFQYAIKYALDKVIDTYAIGYVDPYVAIPHDYNGYLEKLEANKNLIPDFDYVYNMFSKKFASKINDYIQPDQIFAQSIGIGVGTAVLAWALVAALPTAKYLKCRKKYKELVKQNGDLKEEQENVL